MLRCLLRCFIAFESPDHRDLGFRPGHTVKPARRCLATPETPSHSFKFIGLLWYYFASLPYIFVVAATGTASLWVCRCLIDIPKGVSLRVIHHGLGPACLMTWVQREIRLSAVKRGCHLVTKQVESEIAQDLRQFKVGLCHLFSELLYSHVQSSSLKQ
jgi:hypothetical protein